MRDWRLSSRLAAFAGIAAIGITTGLASYKLYWTNGSAFDSVVFWLVSAITAVILAEVAGAVEEQLRDSRQASGQPLLRWRNELLQLPSTVWQWVRLTLIAYASLATGTLFLNSWLLDPAPFHVGVGVTASALVAWALYGRWENAKA